MRRLGMPQGPGARALHSWAGLLRRRVRAAGLHAAPAVFGLAWSGAMSEARVLQLLPAAPDGSELYFHPATYRDALVQRLMPQYRHEDELAALTSPAVRAALHARFRPAPGAACKSR